MTNFTAGFLAGVAGAAANTPWDVCRTNVQKEFLQAPKGSNLSYALSLNKLLGVGKDIVAQRGVKSLYAGFGFKALHMGTHFDNNQHRSFKPISYLGSLYVAFQVE